MELEFLLITSFSMRSYLPSSQQGSKAAHGDGSFLIALLDHERFTGHTRLDAPIVTYRAVS